MISNLTLARVNKDAAEAQRIINSHAPGATAGVTNYPVGELKDRAAHAQETIARITRNAA